MIVWTRLQVPIEEIDTDQWIGYFQPIAKAPGHSGSSWARIEEHPDTALLVTSKVPPDDLSNEIFSS